MQIPVLVERVKGNGYRARGTEPFAVSAKGATRAQALGKLRAKIQAKLKKGLELVRHPHSVGTRQSCRRRQRRQACAGRNRDRLPCFFG